MEGTRKTQVYNKLLIWCNVYQKRYLINFIVKDMGCKLEFYFLACLYQYRQASSLIFSSCMIRLKKYSMGDGFDRFRYESQFSELNSDTYPGIVLL